MRLAGVEVSGTSGRILIDLLLRVGRDADLALAHRIERGYSRQTPKVELSPAESDHLLAVLNDPPPGLAELRDKLARDHRDRQT